MRAKINHQRILDLLLDGWSQKRIAREVGCSQPNVSYVIRKAEAQFAYQAAESVSRYRARQLAELDAMKAAVWLRAVGQARVKVWNAQRHRHVEVTPPANLKAIGVMLRLQEREARLLGLDLQPAEGPTGPPPEETINLTLLSDVELEQLHRLMRKIHGALVDAAQQQTAALRPAPLPVGPRDLEKETAGNGAGPPSRPETEAPTASDPTP
jgi:hypothetical protein